MQVKNLKFIEKTALIVVVTVLPFFTAFIYNFNSKNSIEVSSLPPIGNIALLSGQEKVNSSLPIHFKIPSINVDTVIEQVGLTPDGAMDVPKGPDDVAWYNLGPLPGQLGSAVIAGHSGYKNNRPAVFDNLYKLQKGDKIYVEDGKGIVSTFVVRESRKYNPFAGAAEVFGSSDGKAHLNLITCTGFWNRIWKSHSDRLVVFTDKE